MTTDTTLDEYGLRVVDPDNHRLYWHRPDPSRNYARHGAMGGICTVGDVWDQDAARSRKARPGRLRPGRAPSPLLAGLGRITGRWTVIPGQPPTWRVVARCRRGDVLDDLLPPGGRVNGQLVVDQDYLARLVYPVLERHGWSWRTRVECPAHRAERLTVEAALATLRRQEASHDLVAARGGPRPAAAAPPPRRAAGAASELVGGRP
jgi:hypothetical protein